MGNPFREIEMGPVGTRLPGGVVVSAHAVESGVFVEFGEGSATFLPDWLRDNCQCAECRILQTDERRWQPWTEPAAPVVDTVDVRDGQLRIAWKGGHDSTYGPADWDKM